MGVGYFGGHSTVKTENITSLSGLEIRFKTKEPSGLLAYSVKEVQYMSQWTCLVSLDCSFSSMTLGPWDFFCQVETENMYIPRRNYLLNCRHWISKIVYLFAKGYYYFHIFAEPTFLSGFVPWQLVLGVREWQQQWTWTSSNNKRDAQRWSISHRKSWHTEFKVWRLLSYSQNIFPVLKLEKNVKASTSISSSALKLFFPTES